MPQTSSVKDEAACYARGIFERVPADRREGVAKAVLDVLRHEDGETVLEIISNFTKRQDQQIGPTRYLNRNSILEGFAEVCQSEVAEVASSPGDDDCHIADKGDDASGDHHSNEDNQDEDPLDYGEDDEDDRDYFEVEHGRSPEADEVDVADRLARPLAAAGPPEKLVQAARFAINAKCLPPTTVKIAVSLYERLLAEQFEQKMSYPYHKKSRVMSPMTQEQALNFTLFIVTSIRQLPQTILQVSTSIKTEVTSVAADVEAIIATLRRSRGLDSVERFLAEYSRNYSTRKPKPHRGAAKRCGKDSVLELHRHCELHRLWNQICHEITIGDERVKKEMNEWAMRGLETITWSKEIENGARAIMMDYLGLNSAAWTEMLKNWAYPAEVTRRFGYGGLFLAVGRSSSPYYSVYARLARTMDILWEIDQQYQHPIKDLLALVGREIVQPVIEHRPLPKLVKYKAKNISIHQWLERMGVVTVEHLPESDDSDYGES